MMDAKSFFIKLSYSPQSRPFFLHNAWKAVSFSSIPMNLLSTNFVFGFASCGVGRNFILPASILACATSLRAAGNPNRKQYNSTVLLHESISSFSAWSNESLPCIAFPKSSLNTLTLISLLLSIDFFLKYFANIGY